MANRRRRHVGPRVSLAARKARDIRQEAESQAALMLIESILFTLIERSILTKADVIASIEDVISTKRNIEAAERSPAVEKAAAGLLASMANSFNATSLRRSNGAG